MNDRRVRTGLPLRNSVPFEWIDVERDPMAAVLQPIETTPIALFDDGSRIEVPPDPDRRRRRQLVRAASLDTSMSRYLIDQIEATPTINVWTGTSVHAVRGDGRLEEIVVADGDGERA